MAYVHVAHDCVIGNDNIFANQVTLAGHVHVGDCYSGWHEWCASILSYWFSLFAAVNSIIVQDIPPFVMAQGHNAKPRTINSEGLKRRGYTPEQIQNVRRAYKILYRSSLTVDEATEGISALNEPVLDGFKALLKTVHEALFVRNEPQSAA